MGIVFIVVIFILGILLYNMLNSQEKTYGYTKISTISYRTDGTEQIKTFDETGILFVAKKFVTIDGERYWFKNPNKKLNQVVLKYDGNTLKTVCLNLPENLQRLYYVGKMNSIKDLSR
ncbi:MAG TPA: hypothetical protein PLQ78_07075 [Flavipsychrobacter sp.]|jgi:hypothetical protein|nr:hypothetical protein [Flavipsychrobacter sp.]